MPGSMAQSCSTAKPSSIDLRSTPAAPHHEIAVEAHGIHLAHRRPFKLKDEPFTDFTIGHRVEQQIGFVQGLARKEDLCDEAIHPASAENRKVDMRRPPPPAGLE